MDYQIRRNHAGKGKSEKLKKILDTILNAGELSEAGDIMNFQILLMEKFMMD
jgi:hypothetical protein